MLSIAAATMARDGDARLKSVTMLAAQTDFTEAGELTLFINESQVAFLEDMMWERGVLDTTQMAGAFQLLRSNDLIWSRVSRDYLMGERAAPSDLMAWNADATRLPYRMHSEYLRKLFLNNDLAEGRYLVEGRPIVLSDIHAPMFVVGTVRDHVAPWKSAYKIHYQVDADVTFVLTSGGHNAGIVAPPGEEGHFYQVKNKPEDAPYVGPDEWLKAAPRTEGSWWPEWTQMAGRAIRRALRAAADGRRVGRRPKPARCARRLRAPVVRGSSARLRQVSQFPVGGRRVPQQPLFALRAEKLRARVGAVAVQGGGQRVAPGIVVQLPERPLRLAQVFQGGLLAGKSLVRKQVFESFDRIAQLLVQQAQPMPLLRVHFQQLAALLQELLPPPRQLVHAVGGDRGRCVPWSPAFPA